MEKETYDIIMKYVDWEKLSCNGKLTTEFIREFQDQLEWFLISSYQPQAASADFVREFQDKVYWDRISICQNLSEDFIREFKDYVDWPNISSHQKLSEDFIREFQDKLDWYRISYHQELSEDFIREFKDKVDWHWISSCQKLSEVFIREFKDKVNWLVIGKLVRLSEDFIREFQDRINWCIIGKYPGLSAEFIREFKYDLPREDILYCQGNTPEDIKQLAADPFAWYVKALVDNSTLNNVDPENVITVSTQNENSILNNSDPENVITISTQNDEPVPFKFTTTWTAELIRLHIWRIRTTDKVLKLLKTEYRASGRVDQGPRRSAIDALMYEHRQTRVKDIQHLAKLGCTKYLKQLPKEH